MNEETYTYIIEKVPNVVGNAIRICREDCPMNSDYVTNVNSRYKKLRSLIDFFDRSYITVDFEVQKNEEGIVERVHKVILEKIFVIEEDNEKFNKDFYNLVGYNV